jgi:hypothetical protein
VTVTGQDAESLRVATPSLVTLWRRRCGQDLPQRSDSGLIFGVVEDAKTAVHLAGAGVLLQWLRIIQADVVTVHTQPRELTVQTDSTGTYYACGVARDMKIALRAVLTTLPSIQLVRGQGNTDFIALLPNPVIMGRGWCVAALYVDGAPPSAWDQIQSYQPKDLVGVELYARSAEAPVQYQQVATGCGVVLIWTKYLK